MMKSFKGLLGGDDKKPEANIEMVEELLDSGMIPREELQMMKDQLRSQIKKETNMEVEELLKRRAEIDTSKMSKEEGRMLDLCERLFGEKAKTDPIKCIEDNPELQAEMQAQAEAE